MTSKNETNLLNEEECYRRIKADICNGILMPNQHLVEKDLSTLYGTGRTTVRTVLARLEQEGLVERERYKGARVRYVTEEEAIEILEVRIALECLVVRHAAEKATEEDVAELRNILEDMKRHHNEKHLVNYSDDNTRLHQKLLDISNHAIATKVLDTLHSQSVRFQYRTALSGGHRDNTLEEHQMIVDAVAQRDPVAAEQAMRKHLYQVLIALQHFTKGM
ncbi:GntR family transcriptional regulator [Ammoniphilus sp. CFH 90114]|uniref:GntR family transcriptional regulator n=1 Tax=Ammoniphilus sp. CFH 90114 TaxID=2493665 RepID=UPI00100E9238|nr:GntR family transcriptional regulator [Ammoniphilus sp. CFH 90114]RXT07010.1 GntR family transcriptional regulator [Ammoniphilus sp. CFH 90114]